MACNWNLTAALIGAASMLAAPALADDKGGTTPYLPGGEWRVHDSKRPHPPQIEPGKATNETIAAPADAIVLFDGTSLDAWEPVDEGGKLWPIVDGILVTNTGLKSVGWGGASFLQTKQSFGDIQLHVEWRTPKLSDGSSGQGYGNSGVIMMGGRYEVQVLNSYDNETYADGQAAALYGWKPPLVNASRAPGEWQSYDIIFEAPEFAEDGSLVDPAYVTVIHNGVMVHHRQAYLGPSVYQQVAKYEPHEAKLPLVLQHHGETVHYRNIWVRALDLPSPGLPK